MLKFSQKVVNKGITNENTEQTRSNELVQSNNDFEELVSKIDNYNKNYDTLRYTKENEEQDRRLEELKSIDPSHPLLSVVSSDLTTSKPKIKHTRRMLSMEKITANPEQLSKWTLKFKEDDYIIVQPKLDGHSLSIHYDVKEGFISLKTAVTRGDGKEGNDVSENAKRLMGVSDKISFNAEVFEGIDKEKLSKIEIRGETVIKNSHFKEIQDLYANARNGISLANIKDPDEIEDRRMSFIAYNLFIGDEKEEILDEELKLKILKSFGLETPIYEVHPVSKLRDPNYVSSIVSDFEKYKHDESILDYAIDGVIFKADKANIKRELGENEHDPNWAVAWKYMSEEKPTKLNGIEWTVSRNGYLIPVGILEPVELSKTQVSRVTLNNYAYVKDMQFKTGDVLSVRKSGEIIPFVSSKVSEGPSDNFQVPKSCPSCQSPVGVSSVHLKCSNKSCSGRTVKEISHFSSSLGISNLGEGIVSSLYKADLLKRPEDIFSLKAEKIEGLEGFGVSSAKKIIQSIESAKKDITPEKIIKSIGINGVGERVATRILKKYGSIKNFLETYTIEGLMEVEGFALTNATNLTEALLEEKENLTNISKILGLYEGESVNSVISTKLQGKGFCITGTLSKGRKEVEDIIESHSGVIKSSVNGKLDYLVLGADGGSKKDKAEALGVKIISEEEFLEMIK